MLSVVSRFDVRVGEHNANEEKDCEKQSCADPPQDIEVEAEICHDFTKDTNADDICLVRLKTPITMNRTYRIWQVYCYFVYFVNV